MSESGQCRPKGTRQQPDFLRQCIWKQFLWNFKLSRKNWRVRARGRTAVYVRLQELWKQAWGTEWMDRKFHPLLHGFPFFSLQPPRLTLPISAPHVWSLTGWMCLVTQLTVCLLGWWREVVTLFQGAARWPRAASPLSIFPKQFSCYTACAWSLQSSEGVQTLAFNQLWFFSSISSFYFPKTWYHQGLFCGSHWLVSFLLFFLLYSILFSILKISPSH